ncbi:PRC-barrel domain-containing protein [Catenuloplanes indicus]|uniref:Uncharacterized protein YrrD n=1 Tax=Catenuloplanes indicus TaxID=137267 RepID=A0AAE4AWK6_9ACTN|nr:PRC-barrel domain-containing protein [Catenuloplanes indicus]MDQ0365149.1 uncharacterized protein YrrD [Catenuloplanes indicus]
MTGLVRATDLIGRPVVTLSGENVARIKDVVFAAPGGRILGFTLAARGAFGGRLHQALPWSRVRGAGNDAVMIDDGVLPDRDDLVARAEIHDGEVLGDLVLTDAGTSLGTVTDVIVEFGTEPQVAGYEIRTGDALPPAGRTVLIPRADTMAASGEAVIVPSAVTEHVADDLAGLGATITSIRTSPGGRR